MSNERYERAVREEETHARKFAQPPTVAKALRLLEEGSVSEVQDARVFHVASSGHTYRVVIVSPLGRQASCNCEHGRRRENVTDPVCSHVLAARLHVDRENTPDPFQGLTE